MEENIFVWNNSAVTNSIIDKLSHSPNIKNVFYSGFGNIVLEKSPIELPTKNLLKLIGENNIKYLFANSQANNFAFIDIAQKLMFKAIGSNSKTLKLEASKIYSKSLMKKYNINTASYIVIEDKKDINNSINSISYPCFIKADGYAKGLSSIRINTENDFKTISEKYLNGYYGEDSKKILVEKEIIGEEVSIPLVLDSKTLKILLPTKDYKLKDKQTNKVNTGGMGSYAPYKLSKQKMDLLENLIKKIELMLKKENLFYKGFMTINVIFSQDDIYLLEINTRLGDSEGQVILELLDSDLMELFEALYEDRLNEYTLKWKEKYAMAVNVINNNYPNNNNSENAGITKQSINILKEKGSKIYFYGNIHQDKNFYTGKERIISVVEQADSIKELKQNIYDKLKTIEGYNIYYREDIGI